MKIIKATHKSFNSNNYRATVQLSGDYEVYLEDVTLAKNIAAVEMVAGRRLAVLFFDSDSPKESLVIAVFY